MLRWSYRLIFFFALMSSVAWMLTLCGCRKSPAEVCAEDEAKGDRFVQQGRLESAILEYRNALKAQPSAQSVRLKLARAYHQSSHVLESYQQYAQVLLASPKNTEALLGIAQIYLESGRADDALQVARDIVSREPKSVEARLIEANALSAKGMNAVAIANLRSLAEEQPRLSGVQIILGLCYAAEKDQANAEAAFRKALELEPGSFNARKALAAFYLSSGRAGDAEQLYRAAAKDAPNSPEVLLTLAQFLSLQQRASESEQLYQRVVSLEKDSPQSRFALASFYLNEKRFDDARRMDEMIVKDHSDFHKARLQLAELAMQRGDLKEAEAQVRALQKDYKSLSEVQLTAARLKLAEHEPQPAIDILESSLRQGNSAMAHYLMAAAYGQLGELERSQSELQAAIGADSNFAEAYVSLAQMMLDRGQPKVSLQYCQLARQHFPNRAELALLEGDAFAATGDFKNAESRYQMFREALPASAEGWDHLGQLRLKQKRPADAQVAFEKALQLAPNDYVALDGVITSLLAGGNKAKALEFTRAAVAQRNNAETLSLAGKAMLELGQTADAEQYLQRALQTNPNSFAAYVLLGTLYGRQKQLPQAVHSYETALTIRKNDIGLMTMLGMLYQALGENQKAQDLYTRVLDLEPNAGIAANNMAYIYADKIGDMDKALEMARRARIALPDVPNVSDTLGWIYARRRLNQTAIPLLRQAVKSDPGNGSYHLHLAVALQHSGQAREARQELSAALRLDSTLMQRDEAREILANR